jgi:GxxExxY protein
MTHPSEVPIDVFFRHEVIGRFCADLVVENRVIVEVKAMRSIVPEHRAQLPHYLRSTAVEVGLLLNFGPRRRRVICRNTARLPTA